MKKNWLAGIGHKLVSRRTKEIFLFLCYIVGHSEWHYWSRIGKLSSQEMLALMKVLEDIGVSVVISSQQSFLALARIIDETIKVSGRQVQNKFGLALEEGLGRDHCKKSYDIYTLKFKSI